MPPDPPIRPRARAQHHDARRAHSFPWFEVLTPYQLAEVSSDAGEIYHGLVCGWCGHLGLAFSRELTWKTLRDELAGYLSLYPFEDAAGSGIGLSAALTFH
jgi:hypothetical protein